MRARIALAAVLAGALLIALATPLPAQQPRNGAPPIGTAEMLADGTVVLNLRATGAGGMVGHGRLTYGPNHPQRQEVIDHLGGLRPGEIKPVPPWPDQPARAPR